MDAAYISAQNAGAGDLSVAVSISVMLVAIVIVAVAAWVEHYTGRPNLITRAVDWMAR